MTALPSAGAVVPGDRRPRPRPAPAAAPATSQRRRRQRRRQRRSASLSGTLNGGGSTAQESAQGAWRAGFQDDNSGATVNYDPVGSGTGRENFIARPTSFAGSDSGLSDDEGELTAAKERCGGDDAIEVPAYVSPIAVVFNLDGVDDAEPRRPRRSPTIFDGKITKWNDPAIAADNPGVDLPDTAITPVHRSDDSGTTTNFTDYLSQGQRRRLDLRPRRHRGRSRAARPPRAPRASIAAVKGGEGTIGYADESQAGGPRHRRRSRSASEFNAPSADGAAKVVAASPPVEGRADVDMAIDIDRTTTDVRRLPAAADVVPDRLPDLRRRERGRPGQGLPDLRRRRRGPAGRRRRRPAPLRSTPRSPTGRRHRRRSPPSNSAADAGPRPAGRRRSAERGPPHLLHRGAPVTVSVDRPPRRSRSRARRPGAGDRVFAGLARGAGITILLALAGVFVFLTVEGIPGLSAPERTTAPADRLPGLRRPLLFGTILRGRARAGHRGPARDRGRAVHLALRPAGDRRRRSPTWSTCSPPCPRGLRPLGRPLPRRRTCCRPTSGSTTTSASSRSSPARPRPPAGPCSPPASCWRS